MKHVRFIAFARADEALTFQRLCGGWVLETESGEAVWFRPDFTPSKIFAHPLFRGTTGRLRAAGGRHARH